MHTPLSEHIRHTLGESAAEVFELNQLFLPQEERMNTQPMASCRSQLGSFVCTLAPYHNGQHIAHNLMGNIVHRWDW